MKEIMLLTRYFADGSTGMFVIKALSNLGWKVILIDPKIQKIPQNYKGIILVWCNEINGDMLPKESYKIIVYLDDPKYWEGSKYMEIQNLTKDYDEVYTLQKIEGYKHLPFGCDPDIHMKVCLSEEKIKEISADVSFIGTIRYRKRIDLLNEVTQLLPKNIKFNIWGNNTHMFKQNYKGTAIYFDDFVDVCNSSKIIFNEHFHNSPNTKDFEIPCCGNALYMVGDESKGTKEIYPMIPTFKNAEDLVSKIKYYLEHEKERLKIVEEMQKISFKYTYKKQIKKILDEIPSK